jgi:cyanate permease
VSTNPVDTQQVADPSLTRWIILAGVWMIYFCFGIIIASMAPVLAPISRDLDISNSTMGMILGAWPLTYIFAAIPCGILLDRLGPRRMLFCAALIMALSAVARSLATTPTQLLLAVAFFGFGGPLISVGAPKIIAGLFQGPARATAMGVYVTGPYLGGLVSLALTNSVVMPLVGGDWRGVMLVFAGFTALCGVLWLLMSSGLSARMQDTGGGKKFNLSAFADLVRMRAVQLILAMSIGIFFINHALNNWLPEILVSRGLDVVSAGYWASIPAVIGIVGALIVPRLAIPRYRLLVMGSLFAATLLASVMLQGNPGPIMFIGLILQGLARGSMMTIAILILMETPSVPSDRLGLAGGLFFTTAELGGVLGPVTFGILSDINGGFTVPLASLTLISAALIFILLALRATPGAVAR